MTGGIFMMSNFEGLFSPWRDLETEMDELRSMRRVSQMWRDMDSRDRGAWTMYGRFFDRQMDGVDSLGSFSGSPSHRIKRNQSPKPDSNVIVEFPTDDREIKIEIEPSVEITEVIDHTEHTEHYDSDPIIHSPRNASPVRKSSLVNGGDYSVQLSGSDNTVPSSNMSSVSEEQTIRSADSNKTEKRNKKVDFSKMEVHFEPGSGRVNIVETNGKPPSNQLFRRKKRHRERYRSDSPKLNFVGSPDETYETPPPQTVSENIRFTELENDLNLSIFNLRNSLFKNSVHGFNDSSKNVFRRSPSPTKYKSREDTNRDSVLTDIDNKASFNMSSKLQNMIQKTIIHRIHIEEDPDEESKSPVSLDTILSDKKHSRNVSPGNTLKGKNNSLKRSNSRGKETRIRDKIENNKYWEDRPVHRTKVPVVRGDSFKKNTRVARQDSVKSTSSRGSNGDLRVQKKTNVSRNNSGKISRTPSIGRNPSFSKITTSSLKKGGIYVDASPRKSKGSTVTIISFSGKNPKSEESIDRKIKSPVNNLNNSRNRIARKESFKSSRESLSSQSNRVKNNNELKDSFRSKQRGIASSVQESKEIACPVQGNKASLKKLNFVGRPAHSSSKIVPKISLSKQDSFNSDVTPKYSNIRSRAQIKNITVDSVNKIKNANRVNDEKGSSSFHHEHRSLFQPIKKERPMHIAETETNEIKTPVPIRKRVNAKEIGRETPTGTKITNVLSSVNDKVERRSYKGVGSKLNFVSLKRAKEPLRSFEKISNGWVMGRCNMVNIDTESSVQTEWPTKKVADISLNTVRPGNMSIGSISPVSQISTGSRSNYHRQRESMMRLSQGFSSRADHFTSPALSKNIDTRKRPARLYTPSISPSSVPSVGKRKPAESIRDSPAVASEEPLYETLNSRRKGPVTSSSRVRRTRQTNPCCNI